MRVLEDTLEILTETWDDPGNYPSMAGLGPLPGYDYVVGLEGHIVLELSDEELDLLLHEPQKITSQIELPAGVLSVSKWSTVIEGNRVTVEALDIENDPDWSDDGLWATEEP